ncbi:response regulator transcription factor [Pseudarthrobacter sp. C4D7]|uniref:response regulator transcription factor n=1 Tax=Pseudarthrobacter sp. C4D7 TaxID=2735268 RepID=UPI0015851409|nr:response regulator transcription factor [Pseudarthrobacter sp. C4D7]NUT69812.1 response regulator transcription factor [Pseudarthrobacter sp. C4D7]
MDDLGVAVVIEDDVDVRNLLEGVLTQAGFEVHTAVDGRAGVEAVRSRQANVVTLDIGLPDIDGFEVLRRIRNFSNAYVVMLTGRTDEPDLLSALHAGADDYIAKPFRPRELRARVAAMMRRPRHGADGEAPSAALWGQVAVQAGDGGGEVFRHNGLLLDHRTRTVEVRGEPLGLTRSEFDLLHVLLKGGGAVCTRADLVRAVRGDFYDRDAYISEADERAVEVHVGNLRRKLKEDQLAPRWLQTVRGVGYRLAPRRPDDA